MTGHRLSRLFDLHAIGLSVLFVRLSPAMSAADASPGPETETGVDNEESSLELHLMGTAQNNLEDNTLEDFALPPELAGQAADRPVTMPFSGTLFDSTLAVPDKDTAACTTFCCSMRTCRAFHCCMFICTPMLITCPCSHTWY